MKGKMMVMVGVLVALGVSAAAEQGPIVPKEKMMLWNGKDFSGWTFCTRTKADPTTVWSVKDGVIHCTGKPPGYMRTEADYANYKLHVEWRWVVDEAKEQSKAGKKGKRRRKNSGVLLHMSGPDRVWPKSIECQLMSGNAGDFFVIGGTEFKEHKARVAEMMKKATGKKRRPTRHVPKKGKSSEKPLGEWNCYDIICKGSSVIPHVNGEKKNTATDANVSSGKICLQSEGAPIEFRSVYIEPAQ